MANKYVKRCSVLLIVREMQIKTTLSYQFLPRMTFMKHTHTHTPHTDGENNQCWQGWWRIGILRVLVGMQNRGAAGKTVCPGLQTVTPRITM